MKHVLCLSWSSKFLSLLLLMLSCLSASAQVNSGSNGSDGPFNPTGNVTINMADHPDGIYHYTSVNIPSGVTVTFTPNANNTPVVWLVQGDCVIGGTVDLSGKSASNNVGALGGPGGFKGGNGGTNIATSGEGPGGGKASGTGIPVSDGAGNASFGTLGERMVGTPQSWVNQAEPGVVYGNKFLLPLTGGSGGGGSNGGSSIGGTGGGGGGGGGILIAASGQISISGSILAKGGNGSTAGGQTYIGGGGGGSGGAIRLVASSIAGSGNLIANGGTGVYGYSLNYRFDNAGQGRIRLDTYSGTIGGTIIGVLTSGFQPIIIPTSGQGIQLAIQSIGGVSLAGSPNGVLASPDVILPAQQQNPMNVVVNCSNLPMNTTITVTVRPANGADIVATGTNSSGTQTASTATIPVNMPRGGGIIFAKCVSGVAGSASVSGDDYGKNIAQTGWTAHGERFAQMEITAGIGSSQQVAYITESGKHYTLPVQ